MKIFLKLKSGKKGEKMENEFGPKKGANIKLNLSNKEKTLEMFTSAKFEAAVEAKNKITEDRGQLRAALEHYDEISNSSVILEAYVPS